jgi:GT2 family glycosyltransferase
MYDLSILIVCYRGWNHLIQCLDSLDNFDNTIIQAEVIVVNNAPDDERFHDIQRRYPNFTFVNNKLNGGFGHGCNLGAQIATGEFFLFLNPDTVATASAIATLLDSAKQNPDYGVLSCLQENEKGRPCKASGAFPKLKNLTGWQRALFRQSPSPDTTVSNNEPADADVIEQVDWVSGSVLLTRDKVFHGIGGFDEDFWMYFEDVDLCKRVREQGGKVGVCNNATIEHHHGGSSRIDLRTSCLTKTEVHVSRHIYISKHSAGVEEILMHGLLISTNLIAGGLMALVGLLFFFQPKLFARTQIFFRLFRYYIRSSLKRTWISPRSVNAPEQQPIRF